MSPGVGVGPTLFPQGRVFSLSMLDPSSGCAYAHGVGDQLRFVGTIDGETVIDELIGPDDDVEAVAALHKNLLESAGDKIWVMKISDPDDPRAVPMVLSNDPAQLLIPVIATPESIAQAIEQRRPQGGIT